MKMKYKTAIEALDYSLQLHVTETGEFVYFKMYIVNNNSEINFIAFDKLL